MATETCMGREVHHSSPHLGKSKAKEMLRHGEVRGKPLTKKQRGLFGVIASGKKPRKKI